MKKFPHLFFFLLTDSVKNFKVCGDIQRLTRKAGKAKNDKNVCPMVHLSMFCRTKRQESFHLILLPPINKRIHNGRVDLRSNYPADLSRKINRTVFIQVQGIRIIIKYGSSWNSGNVYSILNAYDLPACLYIPSVCVVWEGEEDGLTFLGGKSRLFLVAIKTIYGCFGDAWINSPAPHFAPLMLVTL